MTALVLIVAVNAVFAALPPYGWMNVLNGLCALAGLGAMALVNR
jgi:hypothetical protein